MKKKNSRYINLIGIICFALLFIGCESDFLDINSDPNNPTEVPLRQLLPAIEVRLGTVTDHATGFSNFAHNYLQYTTVRGNLNLNIITGNDFFVITPWNNAYQTVLTDIREVVRIGTENEDWHYVGIAQIIQAYVFSLLVDYYGDVPYFNANQGAANPTPEFNSGPEIYADIFNKIDEGIANLAKESTLSPGDDDVIYEGDVDKWRRFAKTLKLKLYNQIKDVQDVSAAVQALIAEGDLISSPAEDFEIPYGQSTAPDDRNQGYATEYASGTHSYVNPYFYEVLTNQNTFGHGGNIFPVDDPRLPYYVYDQLQPGDEPENDPAYLDEATGFLSIYSFSYNIDPNEGFDQAASQSVMGLYPVGGRYDEGEGVLINFNGYGAGPLRLLPYFNRLYIEAELALSGEISGDPQVLLESAIRASFAEVNAIASAASAPQIEEDPIDDYVARVMSTYASNPLRTIITQKWIANYGAPVDIYNDYRRTGYPILHDGNTDNLIVTERTRDFIVSLPYANTDLDLYPNPPAQRNPYSSRVFWDVD